MIAALWGSDHSIASSQRKLAEECWARKLWLGCLCKLRWSCTFPDGSAVAQISTTGWQMTHAGLIASLMLDLQLDLGLNVGGKSEGVERTGKGIGSQGNFHQSFSEAGIHSTFVDNCGLLGSRSKESLWAEPWQMQSSVWWNLALAPLLGCRLDWKCVLVPDEAECVLSVLLHDRAKKV